MSKDDSLFSEETINKAQVSSIKFWLLPLIQPTKWRQARWTFVDELGKKHKAKGLLRW